MEHPEAAIRVEAWLQSNGISNQRLDANSPKTPLCLRGSGGTLIWVSVPWSAGGLVIYLKQSFPFVPILVFFPNDALPSELIPHVDYRGEICVLNHNIVVNPHKPEEHIEIVLQKAHELISKNYSDEELISEIEDELVAYWKVSGKPIVLVEDDVLEANDLVGFSSKRLVPDGSRIGFFPKTIISNFDTREILGVEVRIRRNDIPKLCGPRWLTFLHDLTDVADSLQKLSNAMDERGRRLKHLGVLFILRVETTRGLVRLAAKCSIEVGVRERDRGNFARNILLQFSNGTVERLTVEDLRTDRILNRSAGVVINGLSDVRIVLVGCGSVGGLLAELLAGAGVSHFLLIDSEIMETENLGRHVLDQGYLFCPKAVGVKDKLTRRFAQMRCEPLIADVRDSQSLRRVQDFHPTIIISATGDTNTDLFLSLKCQSGQAANTVFLWVEAFLKGGHLVFQPAETDGTLMDLHPAPTGQYRFQLSEDATVLRESGCNTSYTPYSAIDLHFFVVTAAKEIISWLTTPKSEMVVKRWQPSVGTIETLLP